MIDVFISYPQNERELMLPLKRRLEALGLILFVDVDGRLDGSPTFPEALDQGVRAAKAVLGCWSPWALTRDWVRKECGFGLSENKLVTVARLPLSAADVPLMFFDVDRKPLIDFVEDQPHEGWAMTLSALATKLRLWAETRPNHPEAADARAKAEVLDRAAAAERAALGAASPASSGGGVRAPAGAPLGPAAQAWAAIENSLDVSHYRRFVRAFETDPAAFLWVIEAEARAKALERWETVTKSDPDAIAEAIRSGLFPRLEAVAREGFWRAAITEGADVGALAQTQAARRAAEEEFAEHAGSYIQRRAHEVARLGPAVVRAREAAGALRPVSERAFPIELPSVPSWPMPRMIAIPSAQFLMGASKGEEGASDEELPQHEVRIDYVFALGQHTVTFAEWDAALDAGAKLARPGDEGWGRGARPVINVSWEDARAYIAWLNTVAGLAGRPDAYRLPSEAEWEYACRAGTMTRFHFGDTISTGHANYHGDYALGFKGGYREMTMPVGSFPANAFGLHEMHGNVWEWCEDLWHPNYAGAPTNGSAWISADQTTRVLRGGSWGCDPDDLRSAVRDEGNPDDRDNDSGFRLARTLSPF